MADTLKNKQVTFGRFATTNADGIINLSKNDYFALSAYEDGYVLVPYTRTDSNNWGVRVAGGSAYSGSCYVAYVRK